MSAIAALRGRVAGALPFYYGWVVFAVMSVTSFTSRPAMGVATLAVFMVPMTQEFGWSRGLFSGAVSLGGIAAVFVSPTVGRLVDRRGSGLVVGATSVLVGFCCLGLAAVTQSWAFYALFVPGRMAWASPLELGTSTALSNWFIRRRPLAMALFSVTQGLGLALMPFVAQIIITGWSWRLAWFLIAALIFGAGVAPMLLVARRPEDMGLAPDLDPSGATGAGKKGKPARAVAEHSFTSKEALRTRAFWLLAVFSGLGFMAQAGISLHQVGHYINEGMPGPQAALMASVFAFSQVPGGLMWSALANRIPVRFLLAASALSLTIGSLGTMLGSSLLAGVVFASFLGVGVGGLHLLLRLAWADYYGREHLGSIRGLTLPVQIGGQAIGPVFSGFMFDLTHSYHLPFLVYAVGVGAAGIMALLAVPPRQPAPAPAQAAAR